MNNITIDTMFENIPFSKNTRLLSDITSLTTSFTVEDVSVLPSAPNYATIGTDENAETIFYHSISGNELQNVERGIEGTAKSWSSGEIISRNFSNVDVVAFSNNISTIANFLNSHGNLFEYRKSSTAYTIGKCVQIQGIDDYIYLECVQAGTTNSNSNITVTSIGELITDGAVKWLVLDIRDSAPVGTIKQDIIIRNGYLQLNGQTVNTSDYPRLVNFLSSNSLIKPYTATPNINDFTYGDSNNDSLVLPNFNNLFIENANIPLTKKNAGVPNITGSLSYTYTTSLSTTQQNNINNQHKSLKWISTQYDSASIQIGTKAISDGGKSYVQANLDASRENSIYGNSTTVQPPSVTLIPLIKY